MGTFLSQCIRQLAMAPPAPGTPAFFQNFDSSSTGSSGALDDWSANTVVTSDFYSSPKSYNIPMASGATGVGCSKVMAVGLTPGQGDRAWFRARLKFPTGFDFTASPHLKFLRIDTGPAGNGHGQHIDCYLRSGGPVAVGYFDFILEGVNIWSASGNSSSISPTQLPSGIIRNQWQTWEIYHKLHSVSGSSETRMWCDGTLIYDNTANLPAGMTRLATLNAASSIIGDASNINAAGFMIVTYLNGGAAATQAFKVDDFTVYTSNTGVPTATDAFGNPFIGMA